MSEQECGSLYCTTVIETERLVIRPFIHTDLEDMHHYCSDPQTSIYTSWNAHQNKEETKQFIAQILLAYKQKKLAPWAIVHKESAKMIGSIGFVSWREQHFSAEIGYALAREYWSQGLMSEAVSAIMAFGFGEMKLMRIEARCITANIGSRRVMEKCGMSYEGTLRKSVFAKGEFRDMLLYALINE